MTATTEAPVEVPEFKPARRTILRGEVKTFYSTYGRFPKYHLQRECMGRTPDERVSERVFESARALAETREGRPCRACALERVLYSVMRPQKGSERVFVTFTSQACPSSPDVSLRNYNWSASTPSGVERLERVAKRFKLSTLSSTSGKFAYGMVDRLAADTIAWNLRSIIRTDVTEMPDPFVMECVWALMDDHPPELRHWEQDGRRDPWELAGVLTPR